MITIKRYLRCIRLSRSPTKVCWSILGRDGGGLGIKRKQKAKMKKTPRYSTGRRGQDAEMQRFGGAKMQETSSKQDDGSRGEFERGKLFKTANFFD